MQSHSLKDNVFIIYDSYETVFYNVDGMRVVFKAIRHPKIKFLSILI